MRGRADTAAVPLKNVCDEGLFRYFATVIDTVADARLRVFLYHIPHVAQVGISLGLIERLLNAYPEVIAGIKDSSGDWANTSTMIDAFGKSGFDVLAGSETFLLQTLRAGGAGCITATANVNARRIAQLARTWQAPDADDQQQRLDVLRGVFTRFPVIPAMKAAIAWQSGDENWSRVRPPLVELTRTQRAELEAALTAIDFRIENAGSFAEPA